MQLLVKSFPTLIPFPNGSLIFSKYILTGIKYLEQEVKATTTCFCNTLSFRNLIYLDIYLVLLTYIKSRLIGIFKTGFDTC